MEFADFISTSATALSLVLAFVAVIYSIIAAKSRSKLDEIETKVRLEMLRKHYEDSIYETTRKLSLDKERWADANHLLIEASRRNALSRENSQSNPYLDSLSIDREDIKIDPQSVFLMAPIHPQFAEKIHGIKSVCDSIGLRCETADEKFISGPILSLIVKKILSASIVIAIVDGRNPNVFYEIGLAHAFGKIVIMIASGLDEVPFDIQSQRLVVVNWKSDESWTVIRRAISEAIIWSRN